MDLAVVFMGREYTKAIFTFQQSIDVGKRLAERGG
jgi:hypothetical protein